MDVFCQASRRLLVEFQAFTAIDFRIGPPKSFSKSFDVQLVLFNQAMHGFMNERIDVIVIAAIDPFPYAALQVGAQRDIHGNVSRF
ncbi:MAG: hypothetical protein ACLQU1_23745 [Bryobacteraceae bacterium]